MKEKKVLLVLGTRPEAIKLCPVAVALGEIGPLDCGLCVTGQHPDLVGSTLELFGLAPRYGLTLPQGDGGLASLTAALLVEIDRVLAEDAPDLVLVQGDTATTLAAAQAAFYRHIPLGHVEAGLRSYNRAAPFPEEVNRRTVSLMADLHFAPTEAAQRNLLDEGVERERITVTGNTGLDALRWTVRPSFSHPILEWAGKHPLVLLTAHRRENLGAALQTALRGVRRALEAHPEVRLVCPVHPGHGLRQIMTDALGTCEQVLLTDPLDVLTLHNILARCYLVLTDSGGLQEEAAALNVPALVLRNGTERPEGLAAGTMRLVGTSEGSVLRGVEELLVNPALHAAMSTAPNPFGDGLASHRVAAVIADTLLL